jgi:hypothetical protein
MCAGKSFWRWYGDAGGPNKGEEFCDVEMFLQQGVAGQVFGFRDGLCQGGNGKGCMTQDMWFCGKSRQGLVGR